MIAKSQLIDETTVRRHLNDWLNEEKLKPENGGTQSHLSETQTAELIAYLTDNLLPTTAAIINVIEEWWGIRYTVPGLNKWLHKHGFSYRKPVGVPHKFSAEAQQAFVAAYEQLKRDAGDDEPVLFIDGVHPTGDEAGVWLDARRQRSKAGGNQRQPYPAEPDGSYQPDSAG
jgi:transposase